MDIQDFRATNLAALAQDEIRYTVLLTVIEAAASGQIAGEVKRWQLGGPGACAVQTPDHSILLGVLTREQCRALAEMVAGTPFKGVHGMDEVPLWFVERAEELGERFKPPIAERILAIYEAPRFAAPGMPRPITAGDADLFAAWFSAFAQAAMPGGKKPPRSETDRKAASGNYLFWLADGQPVSMAGIVRRTANTAAISAVYTPPEARARGFAGSVTAANVERIFAEGRTSACLYADASNPWSNRCYEKIGFKPVCDAWHILQDVPAESATA